MGTADNQKFGEQYSEDTSKDLAIRVGEVVQAFYFAGNTAKCPYGLNMTDLVDAIYEGKEFSALDHIDLVLPPEGVLPELAMRNVSMDFKGRFERIVQDGIVFIKGYMEQHRRMVLFDLPVNADRTTFIKGFYGFPDFAFFKTGNSAEWAAVAEIRVNADLQIEIDGVMKGDHFPDKKTVVLDELSGIDAICLADYLVAQSIE
jgi:hypothetical protein